VPSSVRGYWLWSQTESLRDLAPALPGRQIASSNKQGCRSYWVLLPAYHPLAIRCFPQSKASTITLKSRVYPAESPCLRVAPWPDDEAYEIVARVLLSWNPEPPILLLWAVVRGGLVVGVVLNEFCDDLLQIEREGECVERFFCTHTCSSTHSQIRKGMCTHAHTHIHTPRARMYARTNARKHTQTTTHVSNNLFMSHTDKLLCLKEGGHGPTGEKECVCKMAELRVAQSISDLHTYPSLKSSS